MRKTGYIFDEAGLWHDTGTCNGWFPSSFDPPNLVQPFRHFENPEAKRRCHSLVMASYLSSLITTIPFCGPRLRIATDDEIALVHTQAYIEEVTRLSTTCEHQRNIGECTVIGRGSALIAKRAVGACLELAEAIVNGECDNGYVLCRPPGHHAEPNMARGFCLFNNVAITAAFLMSKGLERIAIVDLDVHHGNGTERAFYEDPRVLFISVHQDGLYPYDSGHVSDRGANAGLGFNINVPVPPGSGIGCYDEIMKRIVIPSLRKFNPEFVLISAGYDACAMDPLSHTMLNSASYYHMISAILSAAEVLAARGRVLAVHEGGYSEVYAPYCMARTLEAMVGVPLIESQIVDPYDEEIASYSYQALQKHQDLVLSNVCESLGF